MLAAGPHQERPRFDAKQAADAELRRDDVALEAVGREAAMPWETDGQAWHCGQHIGHDGKPVKWEGKLLSWLDGQVHQVGKFSPTNWNHRSVIEIAAESKSQGWFLHMMTGMERYARLCFRVAKNSFKQQELNERLGIRRFNEIDGLQVYGDEDRVQVSNRKGPWQEVAVLAHFLSDIDTPVFKKFLAQAVAAFQGNLKKMSTKVEDVMPWKINGERWHLGEKGFPPGRKLQWDRALLPRLLELVKQVEPKLQVEWDVRDSLKLKVPGVSRSWAQWRD